MKSSVIAYVKNHIEIASGDTVTMNGQDARDILMVLEENMVVEEWDFMKQIKVASATTKLEKSLTASFNYR